MTVIVGVARRIARLVGAVGVDRARVGNARFVVVAHPHERVRGHVNQMFGGGFETHRGQPARRRQRLFGVGRLLERMDQEMVRTDVSRVSAQDRLQPHDQPGRPRRGRAVGLEVRPRVDVHLGLCRERLDVVVERECARGGVHRIPVGPGGSVALTRSLEGEAGGGGLDQRALDGRGAARERLGLQDRLVTGSLTGGVVG